MSGSGEPFEDSLEQRRRYALAAAAPTVVVTGPTATGKTRLAVALAREFGGEILSVDSRQVYRGMDIGTGKDLSEYAACDAGGAVSAHLLDIADPSERYDLYRFLQAARQTLCDLHDRKRLPVLCGGTPLYLAALLDGYEMAGGPPNPVRRAELDALPEEALMKVLRASASPELLARTDITQRRRIIRAIEIAEAGSSVPPPPLSNVLLLAPKFTREEVRERIRIRLDERLGAGLIDEVRSLHDEREISWEQLEWFGLEYRYVGRYLAGHISYDEMHDTLLTQIRQFAKRQDIWFRKLEREGHCIHWIPQGDLETARECLREFLNSGS